MNLKELNKSVDEYSITLQEMNNTAETELSYLIDRLVQRITDKHSTPLVVSKLALNYALLTSGRSIMNNVQKYLDYNPQFFTNFDIPKKNKPKKNKS